MLIALIPMPYVDASASAALPNKFHRMFIAAAGIMVEILLAALALFVWLSVEPGIVRAMAFNVMIIGGISTVLFNGNPLLRFDGYYILADALDIPSLATRSKQYLTYLFQRYVGGVGDAASPAVYAGERFWLFNYAIASNLFRISVMVGIILYIAGKFFVIGVILAIWGATTQIIYPIAKGVAFLMANPQLQGHRVRAIGMTGAVFSVLGLLLFAAPFPLYTATQGVVWAPEKSEIRAETNAIIERLVAEPYSLTEPGDVLLEMDDPALSARVEVLTAELEAAHAEYLSLRTEKQLEADILLEQIVTIEVDLALARERLSELVVRSPTKGLFLLDRSQDLVGRFVQHGDLIGFVAELSTGTVRVAVTQANIGLIRNHTESVSIRLAEQLDQPLTATISREMPSSNYRIPSAVLGTLGGGPLAIDPGDESGTRTLDPVFHIELTFDAPVDRLGGRTYVRFDHGTEPLGLQWYRRVRQLLLRQFNV
jgi:putative peptide zinc metalloprotease protein